MTIGVRSEIQLLLSRTDRFFTQGSMTGDPGPAPVLAQPEQLCVIVSTTMREEWVYAFVSSAMQGGSQQTSHSADVRGSLGSENRITRAT
jgi:hypothetical protein